MKKGISFILLMLLVGGGMAQPKNDYKKKGAVIPSFVIEKPDGKLLNNAILQKGKPIIIAIFSPQCDHCERALDTLQSMSALLKGTQLIFVTEAVHQPQLKDFIAKHGYDKDPVFKNMGVERSNLIYFIYTYGLLPQFNLYDKQHKLIKTFTSLFPMDSLKMFLK